MIILRYRSLQHSFRRSNTSHPSSGRPNRRVGISPSSNHLQDNMSLTLTREEADELSNRFGEAAAGQTISQTKPKKKRRSTVGSGRKWPFGRKSSKKIFQQIDPTSTEDDFLPVFSPPASTQHVQFTTVDASRGGLDTQNTNELDVSMSISFGSSINSLESRGSDDVLDNSESTGRGEVRDDNALVSGMDVNKAESGDIPYIMIMLNYNYTQ